MVLRALTVMALARMGSLHALDQRRGRGGWKGTIGGELPSARTSGRVMEALDCDGLRAALRRIYSTRKRGKSLAPFHGGWVALILDGHESSASYRRCCPGCLTRTIRSAEGERTQYYHREVAGALLFEKDRMPIDAEPQRPGEDEVACAMRLLDRVLRNYPRAFQVVLADGLYLRSDFFNAARRAGKHAIVVLKDERRDLMKDARGLFDGAPQRVLRHAGARCECWDVDGFTSWTGFDAPVRVVRSVERSRVRRQIDGCEEERRSEWMWAATVPRAELSTEGVVRFGHGRWAIENEGGFNELVNVWRADHVYRHSPNAILAFWLIALIAYNLFHAFHNRNVKAVLRAGRTAKYFLDLIRADFEASIGRTRAFAPS